MIALFCIGVFVLAVAVCLFLLWLCSDWPQEIDRKLEAFKREMRDADIEARGWRIDRPADNRSDDQDVVNRIAGWRTAGTHRHRCTRRRPRPPLGDFREN